MSGSESTARSLRLGLAERDETADAVLIDGSGATVATASASGNDRLADAIRRVVADHDRRSIEVATYATMRLPACIAHDGAAHPVAVLRLAGSSDSALPPFAGWPAQLANRFQGPTMTVAGGVDADGSVMGTADLAGVDAFAEECAHAARAVVVSSTFSFLDPRPEAAAAAHLRRQLPSAYGVSASSAIGGFGLLERENAAVINAALRSEAVALVDAVQAALAASGIAAELFLAQNDGTVLSALLAVERPIWLMAGWHGAAVRGAGRRAGASNAIIVDRASSMPTSYVLRDGAVLMRPLPSLAGVRINQPLPFASADRERPVRAGSSPAVERLRRQVGDVPVLEIDGGRGTGSADSALGAAVAPVSATAWGYVSHEAARAAQVDEVRRRAVDAAVLAGADPASIEASRLETPVTYMAGETLRVQVRATGRPFRPVPSDGGLTRRD